MKQGSWIGLNVEFAMVIYIIILFFSSIYFMANFDKISLIALSTNYILFGFIFFQSQKFNSFNKTRKAKQ